MCVGATYTNVLSRYLQRMVLNFGFAGNGIMEISVAQFLTQLDPALFVIVQFAGVILCVFVRSGVFLVLHCSVWCFTRVSHFTVGGVIHGMLLVLTCL